MHFWVKNVFFLFIYLGSIYVCVCVCVGSLFRGAICKEYDAMHVYVCFYSLSAHRRTVTVFLSPPLCWTKQVTIRHASYNTHEHTYPPMQQHSLALCAALFIHYIFSLISYVFFFSFSSIVAAFPYSASCPIIVRFIFLSFSSWLCVCVFTFRLLFNVQFMWYDAYKWIDSMVFHSSYLCNKDTDEEQNDAL